MAKKWPKMTKNRQKSAIFDTFSTIFENEKFHFCKKNFKIEKKWKKVKKWQKMTKFCHFFVNFWQFLSIFHNFLKIFFSLWNFLFFRHILTFFDPNFGAKIMSNLGPFLGSILPPFLGVILPLKMALNLAHFLPQNSSKKYSKKFNFFIKISRRLNIKIKFQNAPTKVKNVKISTFPFKKSNLYFL